MELFFIMCWIVLHVYNLLTRKALAKTAPIATGNQWVIAYGAGKSQTVTAATEREALGVWMRGGVDVRSFKAIRRA